MKYTEIQADVVKKYRVDLCDGTKCENDWSRTHAHVKKRRVCKWKPVNSVQSTFTLLHEIGHIETTKSYMRRCEEEYYATVWALEKCKEYGIEVPAKEIEKSVIEPITTDAIFTPVEITNITDGKNLTITLEEDILVPDIKPDLKEILIMV